MDFKPFVLGPRWGALNLLFWDPDEWILDFLFGTFDESDGGLWTFCFGTFDESDGGLWTFCFATVSP